MTNIIFQFPEDLDEKLAARLEQAVVRAVAEMPLIKAPAFDEYMTCEEASCAVGEYWKPKTIRRYVVQGRLPGVVDGKLVMVNRKGLQDRWRQMENGKDK